MTDSPDLQIDEDLRFQRREWTVERAGWVALLSLVVIAVVGLFGHGPISWTTAAADDGSVEVSYERFGRAGGTQELVVRAPSDRATNGVWELEISRGYAQSLRFDSISPQPDSVEAGTEVLRYTFTQADPSADLEATFSVTPRSLWGTDGRIGLADAETVEISHFFFP